MNSKKKKSNKHRSKKPNRRKKTPKVNQATDKPLGVEALPPSDSDTLSQVSVGSLDSKPIKSASKTTNGYKKGLLITIILGLLSPIVSVFIAYHPYLANGKFCATVNGNEVKSPFYQNCLVYFDTDSLDLISIDIFPQIKNDSRFPLKDVNLKYTIQSESAVIDFTSDYTIHKNKKSKEAINADKTIYSNVNAPRPFEQFVMKDEGHATIDLEATYAGAKNPFSYHSEIYAVKKTEVGAKKLLLHIANHDRSSLLSEKRQDEKRDLYILENDKVSVIEDCQYKDIMYLDSKSRDKISLSKGGIRYGRYDRYDKGDRFDRFDSLYDSIYTNYHTNREYDDTDSITPDFSIFDSEPEFSILINYKIVIGVVIVSIICILGLIILIRRIKSNRQVKPIIIKGNANIGNANIGNANLDNANIDNAKIGNTTIGNATIGNAKTKTKSIEANENQVKKTLSLPVVLILFATFLYVSLYFILEIFFETPGWFWQGLAILSIALVLWPVSRWIVKALSKNHSERFPKELFSILLWILLISIIALLFVFFI